MQRNESRRDRRRRLAIKRARIDADRIRIVGEQMRLRHYGSPYGGPLP